MLRVTVGGVATWHRADTFCHTGMIIPVMGMIQNIAITQVRYMQRTNSLTHVGGVRFPRHGNAGTQSPEKQQEKVNQIGRFIFNSAKYKNITCLSERHFRDHMTSFAS